MTAASAAHSEPLHPNNHLSVKDLGIDTYRENIIFMRSDCHVCTSEGFTALTRVVVRHNRRSIIATLNVIHSNLLHHNEAGLSTEAIRRLQVKDGDVVSISHLQPIPSVGLIRAKMYGKELGESEFEQIISDITNGLYSNIELAAFISATSGNLLSLSEIKGLTRSMIHSGSRLKWNGKHIFDKHCIGGLPGNRTTPIVVSIAAAFGLTIPKTSSRAITSPAGTADVMEVMTNVNLGISEIKKVLKKENACMVWGGSVSLSPADDILISVEKALDIDSEGQLIASVLSKKAAAGSTHVILDIPMGKTAKVRSQKSALRLKKLFEEVARSLDIHLDVLITDGSQPIGRGIGPALEAMDVLSVLRNSVDAPLDLRNRALLIAGKLLELSGEIKNGEGLKIAEAILDSGDALKKFMAICEAQGRFSEPVAGKFTYKYISETEGTVKEIDCRRLAKVAKLAGAPKSPGAGIHFLTSLGGKIKKGDPLFTIYSESNGELEYAKNYLRSTEAIIKIN